MTSEISTFPKVWTNNKPNEGCLRCSELARRAPQYDLSKDERERPYVRLATAWSKAPISR